ncbi:LppU/SCO3897 family protein [Mycolicibacterium mengxianglii]|uniref:LppU/SCO3897 family protein n=1 Tax=Mycolicibacterium mengxianglii TaxID=2736649 RepID=UPI0018D08015|nr:hypothetical protein [Mycolicibacterium mengxianglii]
MLVEVVADGLGAYRLGQATAALTFPLAGAVLLAIGIRRRRAHDRWNRRDDERLLHPGSDDDQVPPSLPPGRGTVFIILGVVALMLGAGHVLSYLAAHRTSSVANELDVGQCITAEAYSQGRMNAEAADCSRTDATLQLVSQGDSTATCPDGNRQGGQYPMLTNDARTQCFILNLIEAHCYAVARAAVPVDCTDPTANVKVASRVEGTAEDAACGADAEVLAYGQPQRGFCLIAP